MTAQGPENERACPAPFDDNGGDAVLFCRTVTFLLERRANRRGCRGCSRAWERFYDEFHPLVRRIVAHQSLDRATFEDCVQEAWTEIVVKLPGLRYDADRGPLQGWLGTVAWRKVRDFLRSRQLWRPLPEADLAPISPAVDPAAGLLLREDLDRARELLTRLRPGLSELSTAVVQMRLLEGRSVAETAASLGLTAEQVWAREHRAKKRLRALAAKLVS